MVCQLIGLWQTCAHLLERDATHDTLAPFDAHVEWISRGESAEDDAWSRRLH